MKYTFLLFIFLIEFTTISAQNNKLKTYTFSEVEKLQNQNPKPLIVFIYTDWCKICLGMKQTTFKNNEVVSILNNNFYFIKLNGEEKKDIRFLRRTFTYEPTGNNTGVHQLTKELASVENKISYPTITVLNSKFEIDLQISGYIKSEKMKNLLNNYLAN